MKKYGNFPFHLIFLKAENHTMLSANKICTPLSILCFLLAAFPLTFSSFTYSSDEDMVLELILSGMQYYDSLIKSGEGGVIYKRVQTPGLSDDGHSIVHEYYLTFNQCQMRMDHPERRAGKTRYPKQTYIDTGSEGEWYLYDEKSQDVSNLAYSTTTNREFVDWHPMAIMTYWEEGSIYKHLKQKNFKIKERQELNQVACYVLENAEGEKIWIAPEQGFRFLQYERRYSLRMSHPRRGLNKGTPMIARKSASYQEYGHAWFPKQTLSQGSFIDEKGQEQILVKTQTETKNFRVNHSISEETFIVEIPDNAMIYVGDLRRRLSKKEFLNLYNLEWVTQSH